MTSRAMVVLPKVLNDLQSNQRSSCSKIEVFAFETWRQISDRPLAKLGIISPFYLTPIFQVTMVRELIKREIIGGGRCGVFC